MPTYIERSELAQHPLAKKLLRLMSEKKSNLAFSADVSSTRRLLDLTERVGPEICVLKTHLDALDDYTPGLPDQLRRLAEKHGFLILEDRKFADIGNTVRAQYSGGFLRISEWSDLVTVHGVAGAGTVEGLKSCVPSGTRGALLLAEMSSSGNLLNDEYRAGILKMAQEHSDFVIGLIAQRRLLESPGMITFTPGVGSSASKGTLGQNYKDPFQAIAKDGSDVIIVGRHIYDAEDPLAQARYFREQAWRAYLSCQSG